MGTKFNSQICTSKAQSERLLALGLKKETADFPVWGTEGLLYMAWSLHRLIEMMPCDIEISGMWVYANRSYQFMEKDNVFDNLIDLMESIIKEGYFNKEYLEE